MVLRRRPLLRAAAIGTVGYAAGSAAATSQQHRAQQREMEAQTAELNNQTAQYNALAAQQAQAIPQQVPSPSVSQTDRVSYLKQLGDLHNAGVLTDEEFQQEKQRILQG